jgi:hypothetical protein
MYTTSSRNLFRSYWIFSGARRSQASRLFCLCRPLPFPTVRPRAEREHPEGRGSLRSGWQTVTRTNRREVRERLRRSSAVCRTGGCPSRDGSRRSAAVAGDCADVSSVGSCRVGDAPLRERVPPMTPRSMSKAHSLLVRFPRESAQLPSHSLSSAIAGRHRIRFSGVP